MMRMRATVPNPMYMPPPSLLDPGFRFLVRTVRFLDDQIQTARLRHRSASLLSPLLLVVPRRRPSSTLDVNGPLAFSLVIGHMRRRMPRVPPPICVAPGSTRRARWPPHRLAPDASEPLAVPVSPLLTDLQDL